MQFNSPSRSWLAATTSPFGLSKKRVKPGTVGGVGFASPLAPARLFAWASSPARKNPVNSSPSHRAEELRGRDNMASILQNHHAGAKAACGFVLAEYRQRRRIMVGECEAASGLGNNL